MRERIDITSEYLEAIEFHIQRTGLGVHAILSGKRHILPKGLTAAKVNGWRSRRTKTAKPEHLQFVSRLWKYAPDKPQAVRITERYKSQLRREMERTGVGVHAMLKGTRNKMPEGLNAGIVRKWFNGGNATARQDHLTYVLDQWKALPDKPQEIPVTEAMREALRAEIERTGLSPKMMLSRTELSVPGVSAIYASSLLNGTLLKTYRTQFQAMIEAYQSCPDNCGYRM
ncbi:MAG: hypothetical protein AAFV45_12755 [Pseudomonadota bacterium]